MKMNFGLVVLIFALIFCFTNNLFCQQTIMTYILMDSTMVSERYITSFEKANNLEIETIQLSDSSYCMNSILCYSDTVVCCNLTFLSSERKCFIIEDNNEEKVFFDQCCGVMPLVFSTCPMKVVPTYKKVLNGNELFGFTINYTDGTTLGDNPVYWFCPSQGIVGIQYGITCYTRVDFLKKIGIKSDRLQY